MTRTDQGRGADHGRSESVLFVANFPANTGFAWHRIERLFASLAGTLFEERGVRSLVAYPKIHGTPSALAGSGVPSLEIDVSLTSLASIRDMIGLIKRERVTVLYLTDRPVWDWRYAILRWAGVRRILIHDRRSGAGTRPSGLKRVAKGLICRTMGITADHYIAISDFVRHRLINVARVPDARVTRVYNGYEIRESSEVEGEGEAIHELCGIPPDTPLIACACRAAGVKGVHHLFKAFDRLLSSTDFELVPRLVYVGDGPYFERLQRLRSTLPARDHILLFGYVEDAVTRLREADLFVVPSIWQEGLGNAVLEPMAWARPVIASAVGGITEVIQDGETGILVGPGDEAAIAEAMRRLLLDPERRTELGRRAQASVKAKFSLSSQVQTIASIILDVEPARRSLNANRG